ncbi:MAG TPA: DUF4153 domain-containing protein [Candidatus Kapabacteria bacterium]|nr:DUF4153 domain-containing protein [Candidatus Kapabacteria bacterium]
MRLPSLDHLTERALKTLKRFPATLLVTITGAVAFMIELETQRNNGYQPGASDVMKVGLTCLLGLPLSLAIELWLERRGDRLVTDREVPPRKRRASYRILLYLIAVVILGIVYYEYSGIESDAIQLFIFVIAAMLAVAFIPYLRRNETNGFWQYNKVLLIRLLTSVFYSGVLMLGLSLALLAIDRLFQVQIDGETYVQLGCILGVFNTWFFLSGIPYSLAGQDERTDYPRGLKIFTQFVLLPLVTIYLAILYPYAAKLLIEWDLPRGWVSNPVLWFAVVGILSFLLLYPIRNEPGNEWIRSFARYFYIALLPLLALPALGIYTRVRDYGITEPRYFVIVLTLWLLGISLYFILSKRKDIRLIPITLCIVAVVSSVGPLSAFTISRADQYSRLEALLEKHQLIGTTRDLKQNKVLPRVEYDEIRSISTYLQFEHEAGELERWIETRLPPGTKVSEFTYDRDIATLLNITPDIKDKTGTHIEFGRNVSDAQVIRGFDHYSPVRFGLRDATRQTLISSEGLTVRQDDGKFTASYGDDELVVRFDSLFAELVARRDSVIRIGGNTDSVSVDIYRTSPAIDMLITIHEGSVELSNEYYAAEKSAKEPAQVLHYWGQGALFIRVKR